MKLKAQQRHLLKWQRGGRPKQSVTFSCVNQLTFPSGVVTVQLVLRTNAYCNTILLPSSQNVLGSILCLSRFLFFHLKTTVQLMTKNQITFDWNFCFDVSLTVRKKGFNYFARKGKKERKAFPSLVSVHCQHIKYSMGFLLCERNGKEQRESGRLMLWSFMYKHIGGKHNSSPRPSKFSALRVLAVIVSSKAA